MTRPRASLTVRGLRTSPALRNAYEEIERFRDAAIECGGEVVVFPHIPVVLLDSSLTPGGRLAQYWYDFSSESEIQREIERLQTRNLSAVVLLNLPYSVIESHEILFNEGNALLHRQLSLYLQQRVTAMTRVIDSEIAAGVHLQMFVNQCVRVISGT